MEDPVEAPPPICDATRNTAMVRSQGPGSHFVQPPFSLNAAIGSWWPDVVRVKNRIGGEENCAQSRRHGERCTAPSNGYDVSAEAVLGDQQRRVGWACGWVHVRDDEQVGVGKRGDPGLRPDGASVERPSPSGGSVSAHSAM